MTNKTRVLMVTQEMNPYLMLSSVGEITRQLPQYLQEKGMELRVLMPRFGAINERRHRLHEVVRLSGINIIIEEDDFPLIIKVASLPNSRLQVYFLDNDDFYKRKNVDRDDNGEFFDDNTERMVFFCKGVLETVKKFGWAPDVIHCHGWMTSLMPLYVKKAYNNDPIFANSSVIYSVYKNSFDEDLGDIFEHKVPTGNISTEDLSPYGSTSNEDLNKGAIFYSDAIIKADKDLSDDVISLIDRTEKPVLDYIHPENGFLKQYEELYKELLANKVSKMSL
ncbi:MAG: glycogen/starch synthase [Sphingobacteriales bacterium]|nr:MAG: glycogen/starch synthase [Sphingobacteriales bacterium]